LTVPDTEFNLAVLLSVDEIHGDIQLIHDPSVAKVNGTYYLYSTGKVQALLGSLSSAHHLHCCLSTTLSRLYHTSWLSTPGRRGYPDPQIDRPDQLEVCGLCLPRRRS
jgi:hypothetical protein